MGNSHSDASKKFLDAPYFETYVQSKWRSARANELDSLGGLGRKPVPLGGSFTAKLAFLGDQLHEQGEKLAEIVTPAARQESSRKAQPAVQYYLNTDRRAAERRGQPGQPEPDASAPSDQTTGSPGGGGSHSPGAAPGERAPGARVGYISNAEYQKMRRAVNNNTKRAAKPAPKAPPAEWRQRIHTARRKAFIMVLTMNRFKRGCKHPKRFPRFDNLSFLIPQALSEDCSRFVDEQRRYASMRETFHATKAELEEALRAPIQQQRQQAPEGAAAAPSAGVQLPPLPGAKPSQPAAAAAAAAASAVHMAVPSFPAGSSAPSALSILASPPKQRMLQPQMQPVSPHATSDEQQRPVSPIAAVLHLTPPSPKESANEGASDAPDRSSGGGGLSRRVSFQGDRESPSARRQLLKHPSLQPQHPRPWGSNHSNAANGSGSSSSSGASGGASSARRQRSLSADRAKQQARLAAINEEDSGELKRTSLPAIAGGRQPGLPPAPSPKARRYTAADAVDAAAAAAAAEASYRGPGAASPPPLLRTRPTAAGLSPHRNTSMPSVRHVAAQEARSASSRSPGSFQRQSSMPVRQDLRARQDFALTALVDMKQQQQGQQQQQQSVILPALPSPGPAAPAAAAGSLASVASSNGRAQQQQQQQQDQQHLTPRERVHLLREEIDKQAFALKKCVKLLTMYVNRRNGAWAESQQLRAPEVSSTNEVSSWSRGDQYSIYRADVMRQLRLGQMAVHIVAGEDYMQVPLLGQGPRKTAPQDLWTADPWELVDQCRPGIMPATDRVEGLSLGGRVLCQLALAVSALAGKDAVSKLHVVVHINEEQQDDVVEEMHAHKCYGLNRANVLLVVQQRHPGYRYDPADGSFVPDAAAAASVSASISATSMAALGGGMASLGSGHALVQLAWAGEAFTVGEDGLPQPLDLPVLEHFEAKKVEWLISRRCRDMALLAADGAALDLTQLAYSMALRDSARANAVVEVAMSDSAVMARQMDSVVLSHSSKTSAADSPLVAELRSCEVVTPKVIELVESLKGQAGGRLAVGLGRHLLHVPTLRGQLSSLSVFRPRLLLHRELLHVTLDAADLLSNDKGRCVALEARVNRGMLSSPDSLDSLIPLLQAQDHDAGFRELVFSTAPAEEGAPERRGSAGGGATVVSGNKSARKPGQAIIVLCVNNNVTNIAVATAANVARAGRDVIHLVTLVPTDLQRHEGEEMLAHHQKTALKSMAEVQTHVVVRGSTGLLDCMERTVSSIQDAHGSSRAMVVMGSAQLTSNVFTYVVGSVTLAVIKRLAGMPVLVVTANSKQIPAKPGMRCLALVEGHSRGLLHYLCGNVVDHARGDRLLLAQVLPTFHMTRQQQANNRRLLDNFHTLAFSHQTPVHKALVAEGALDRALCDMVEEHGAAVVALQMPPGCKSLPQPVLAMLRSCRGATLIHQDLAVRASMVRKSGAFRKSMHLMGMGGGIGGIARALMQQQLKS